jgi:phenylacetic acid degradation operon negative regulatory protein
MLWAADHFCHPTFRNLNDGFESWAHRRGFLPEIERLETRQLVEPDKRVTDRRLYQLSELGRSQVLGGRDPETHWARSWDGEWRMVMFDVPMQEREVRDRVRYYLRTRYFGCLQQSVWVAPEIQQADVEKLGREIDASALLLIRGRPLAGEQDDQIVTAAWDFAAINSRYTRYLSFLETQPKPFRSRESDLTSLRSWVVKERDAWSKAVALDPMLPAVLLPKTYLGREAWERRKETSQAVALRLLG